MLPRVFTAAPHSLPMSRLLTSRSYKSSGRVRQSTRGSGKDAREHGKEALQRARQGGILPRKLPFGPLRVGILERFLDTLESSSRPNFWLNQNFQNSIFKPATAITFREEMRRRAPKFLNFFSRSFFNFEGQKSTFWGNIRVKKTFLE